jgi:hypothetical protein
MLNSTLYYQVDSIIKSWAKLGLSKPRNKDKINKNKLFNNLYTYNAILAFLDVTKIDLRFNNNEREEEEAHN